MRSLSLDFVFFWRLESRDFMQLRSNCLAHSSTTLRQLYLARNSPSRRFPSKQPSSPTSSAHKPQTAHPAHALFPSSSPLGSHIIQHGVLARSYIHNQRERRGVDLENRALGFQPAHGEFLPSYIQISIHCRKSVEEGLGALSDL